MKAYLLDITLRYCEPRISRRVILPAEITFEQLHRVIQAAMGWEDSHLYEFILDEAQTQILDGMVYDDMKAQQKYYQSLSVKDLAKMPNPFLAKLKIRKPRAKIDQYLEKGMIFQYIYDFGDDWIHDINVVEIEDNYKANYPEVLSFEGGYPIEDCGGPPGYEEIHHVMSNPNHPEYKDMKSWLDPSWDAPYDLDYANIYMEAYLQLKRK
ncbi:Plasmid pRiA4b ORF-3-like protein [Listeria weihenstephanensis FSL R9-0317]|uniref:Plasmid pRiA4b Orf3-like domain-containing protein n=1 Tax=Listeria weihenstephanensis TaxID=1006155 RepID=A0A1S7FVJ8_9LIST|nr:plasmid pRiA4b ORF-3 family protein [Listeria weihenstephanensis]AQY51471.1 hypothetical protein UE46_10770 [Listeria weihenstephanensis]EUJ35829.1 Plasmid pRiA4b ORF-3-like protein [Listeria weihenstephanensis FSL R9-0317]